VFEAWPLEDSLKLAIAFGQGVVVFLGLWRWSGGTMMMGPMMMAKSRRRETFLVRCEILLRFPEPTQKSGTFSLSSVVRLLWLGYSVVWPSVSVVHLPWRCLFGANVNVSGLSAGLFGYLATLPFWLRPVSLSAPFAL